MSNTITTTHVKFVYEALKNRLINPDGSFDQGGRWYPSDAEDCGVSATVRSPSKAWPFSYMVACRTLKHVKVVAETSPQLFQKHLNAAVYATALAEAATACNERGDAARMAWVSSRTNELSVQIGL